MKDVTNKFIGADRGQKVFLFDGNYFLVKPLSFIDLYEISILSSSEITWSIKSVKHGKSHLDALKVYFKIG